MRVQIIESGAAGLTVADMPTLSLFQVYHDDRWQLAILTNQNSSIKRLIVFLEKYTYTQEDNKILDGCYYDLLAKKIKPGTEIRIMI